MNSFSEKLSTVLDVNLFQSNMIIEYLRDFTMDGRYPYAQINTHTKIRLAQSLYIEEKIPSSTSEFVDNLGAKKVSLKTPVYGRERRMQAHIDKFWELKRRVDTPRVNPFRKYKIRFRWFGFPIDPPVKIMAFGYSPHSDALYVFQNGGIR